VAGVADGEIFEVQDLGSRRVYGGKIDLLQGPRRLRVVGKLASCG
jgi:hypothetical protein